MPLSGYRGARRAAGAGGGVGTGREGGQGQPDDPATRSGRPLRQEHDAQDDRDKPRYDPDRAEAWRETDPGTAGERGERSGEEPDGRRDLRDGSGQGGPPDPRASGGGRGQ